MNITAFALGSWKEHAGPLKHNHLKSLWYSSASGSSMTLPENYHAQLGVTIDQGLVLLGSLDDVTLVEGERVQQCGCEMLYSSWPQWWEWSWECLIYEYRFSLWCREKEFKTAVLCSQCPTCQPWVAQRGKTLPKNQKEKTKTNVLFLHLPEDENSGIVEVWNLVWVKSRTNG